MSDSLVPLLIFALLIGIGWALRRRPSRAPYLAALDSLDDAILVYDERGQLAHLNRSARVWFGFDEADRIESQALHAQISPIDDFLALLSQGGHASLKIGSRYVEAFSRRVEVQGASQVTLGLENVWLYERTDPALSRRIYQVAAIEEVGRELTSTLDITRVFNVVLQRAMGSTGASAGLLALCDASCSELELIVERGYPPGTLERYRTEGWSTTHGIAGRVARTGERVLVNDVQADSDYIPFLPTTCAQLIVPIVNEKRVLGVVVLESSRSQGFSPDDVRFTAQLAELAAIAIDNARLFQQVREGRDNLQAILDSAGEGVLVVGRDERIALANPMIEKMSDLSAQELVGTRVGKLVTQLDPRLLTLLGYPTNELEEALSLLDAASNQVTKRTFELPGSPSRNIEQVASPLMDKDGVVVGRLIVLRDVTEERQLVMMRQNLTDMIIHDLRSPMTAVVGGVQVASDLVEASADQALIQEALDLASQSCNRLMSLVESFLDISRLEAGQMPLDRHPIVLSEVAQSVIQQMKPVAELEMVALRLQAAPQVQPVDANQELISRVLINLIDNAIKHSPRNSTVAVEIGQERVKGERGFADSSLGLMDSADSASPSVWCTVLDVGPASHVNTGKGFLSGLHNCTLGAGERG